MLSLWSCVVLIEVLVNRCLARKRSRRRRQTFGVIVILPAGSYGGSSNLSNEFSQRLRERVNLLLLSHDNLAEVDFLGRARVAVLGHDPKPVLVEMNHCLLTRDNRLLEAMRFDGVEPLVEVDKRDVKGVSVRSLLGNEVDAVNLSDSLAGELLGDELFG